MIKVLREGTKKQTECNECGALLEYTNKDIEKTQIRIDEYINSITCPCCKDKILLSVSR